LYAGSAIIEAFFPQEPRIKSPSVKTVQDIKGLFVQDRFVS